MPSPSASPIIRPVDRAEPTRGSILVVDDEPTIAEVVARYLTRGRLRIRTAGTGRPRSRPQHSGGRTLVLDIMLPGFDGLEVMRRIHEDADGRVPVILLTAKGEESDRLIGLAGSRRLRRQAVLTARAGRPGRCRPTPDRPGQRQRGATADRRARGRSGDAAVVASGQEVELDGTSSTCSSSWPAT